MKWFTMKTEVDVLVIKQLKCFKLDKVSDLDAN